jgi:putative redox protein
MVKIKIDYMGNLQCLATHEPSGASLKTEAPKDNQGNGDAFSPTDLVSTALATCIATLIGIYAKKRRWDIKGMQIEISKEMSSDAPRRIVRMPVTISLPLELPEEDKALLESVAYNCPVFCSLNPEIEAPITFK